MQLPSFKVRPLVRPQFAAQVSSKKAKIKKRFDAREIELEFRRKEHIAHLRRNYEPKPQKKFHFWQSMELVAIVLMTTGLSFMAIKTALDSLFL